MRFFLWYLLPALCAYCNAQPVDTLAAFQAYQTAGRLITAGKYDSCLVYYQQGAAGYRAYAESLPDDEAFIAIRQKAWTRQFGGRMKAGSILTQIGQRDSAIALLSALEPDVKKQLGNHHLFLPDIYLLLGRNFRAKCAYLQAIDYHEKSRAQYLELLGPTDKRLASVYANAGGLYLHLGMTDRGLDYLQKARQLLDQRHPFMPGIYNSMGIGYLDRGAYDQALEYLQKALALRLELVGPNHLDVTLEYNNIGIAYQKSGANDRALEYYQKALTLRLEHSGLSDPEVANGYHNIGNVHHAGGAYDLALEYYQKALTLRLEHNGPHHPDVANYYMNMGAVYLDKGAYDQALACRQKALALHLELLGPRHPDVASNYAGIGTIYAKTHTYDRALDWYEKSLTAYIPTYQSNSPYTGLAVTSPGVLNGALLRKTETLLARRAPGDAAVALATVRFADRLIDSLRQAYTHENDKLQLGAEAHRIYGLGLDVARWNGLEHEAFYYAEKNKAAVLTQNLNESAALQFGGVPAELVQKDRQLKLDMAFYHKSIVDLEQACPDCDSALLRRFQTERFARRQQYDTLLAELSARYPKYYALKHRQHTMQVEDLQTTLLAAHPNTAVLEYFMADSVLFIFLVTKDRFAIHRQTIDTTRFRHANALKLEIVKLARALSDSKLMYDPPARIIEPASRLYDFLIKPFEADIEGKELVIIPDGELQLIPFEVLLKDDRLMNWHELPFLVHAHNLSYHYSAALLVEAWRKERSTSEGWLAFAPVFTDTVVGHVVSNRFATGTQSRTTDTDVTLLADNFMLSPLPDSEREVKTIYNLFSNKGLPASYHLYGCADEADVLNTDLARFRYLHFATHGLTDEDFPSRSCLLMARTQDSVYDNLLTGSEMYALNLDADLVVLSACQTGKGQLRAGEGVIGLTQGLLYAGARNLVVSQWNVNDASTAELMTRFYTHLLAGQSNRAALRKAKLELLSGPYACPHYWAPFVLVGR